MYLERSTRCTGLLGRFTGLYSLARYLLRARLFLLTARESLRFGLLLRTGHYLQVLEKRGLNCTIYAVCR
jgi:hypothetical protein